MGIFVGPNMRIVKINNSISYEPTRISKKNIEVETKTKKCLMLKWIFLKPVIVVHGTDKAAARKGFSKQEEN